MPIDIDFCPNCGSLVEHEVGPESRAIVQHRNAEDRLGILLAGLVGVITVTGVVAAIMGPAIFWFAGFVVSAFVIATWRLG